jgi:hypothetical protein
MGFWEGDPDYVKFNTTSVNVPSNDECVRSTSSPWTFAPPSYTRILELRKNEDDCQTIRPPGWYKMFSTFVVVFRSS